MNVLVINCGSSSLKYQLINTDDESVLAKGLVERIGIEGSLLKHEKTGLDKLVIEEPLKNHKDAINLVLKTLLDEKYGAVKSLDEIDAVGHRVVHGGEKFASSVLIDDEVIEAMKECIGLAPLHNPPNIIGIEACKELLPDVPMVGVFDTAFHQTMPPVSFIYPLPYDLYEEFLKETRLDKNILLTGEILKIDDSLTFSGKIEYLVKAQCARCLEEFDKKIETKFSAGLVQNEDMESDEIQMLVTDGMIRMDEIVKQLIYLSMPMKSLCRDDCKGICPNCGVNLNEEICQCESRLIPLYPLQSSVLHL
jgi:uncharacterized metal-binding protein YceD (DUF177 family)